MPTRPTHPCAQRATTEALARGELPHQERTSAEQHLAHCQACRLCFRQRTADRFPKLRNYTILSELGRGGFGVVYKALHHSKERSEALKVLFGRTAQRTAYFENEVRLVSKLRHPNIATLYEASLSTTPLYYAMEFVEGDQLDDYLRSHEVTLEQRIDLLKAVVAAIDYAHQQGVIHRDLKPQNILVDPQGQPRIVDFGIAKRLGLERQDDEQSEAAAAGGEGALGTYGYISPEQLAGQEVDWRADIYSLGALLFHVITGQPARFAPQVERLTEVLHERQVSRADDLAAIIACCVRPLPEQRYPNCETLVRDLDNYLAGRPIRAREDSTPGYRVARIAALVLRNHPLSVQAVTVLLVACLLTLSFWSAGAQWLLSGSGGGQTALIAFTPSTLDALRRGQIGADLPGLDPNNPKSRRLLYGQLMEKLADAQPRAVIWDYYFPDCQPEFDAAFIRGVRALPAPVIVGSKYFDLNGEPLLCREIRAAVRGWGTLLSTEPGYFEDEVFVPLATRRGFAAPLPSLALAGSAAARRPDCDADVRVTPDGLELRYRKRHVEPNEPRWYEETDPVPVVKTELAGPSHALLKPDDECLFGRFQLAAVNDWVRQAIPMERVLTADSLQRRHWFSGRAVLIGQMLPEADAHEFRPGEFAFGCQIQAMILDNLLGATHFRRVSHAELAALVCLCCLLAAVAVSLFPTRATWPVRVINVAAVAVFAFSIALAVGLPLVITTPWAMGANVAACALLAAGAATLVIKLLHQRQLHLTPGPIWSAEGTTTSTTVLAATPKNSPA